VDDSRPIGDHATEHAKPSRPLMSRGGFIAAAALGVIGLYGLLAAFGAAPFFALGHDDPSGGYGISPAHDEPVRCDRAASSPIAEARGRACTDP
jgi:hypothetical protein